MKLGPLQCIRHFKFLSTLYVTQPYNYLGYYNSTNYSFSSSVLARILSTSGVVYEVVYNRFFSPEIWIYEFMWVPFKLVDASLVP